MKRFSKMVMALAISVLSVSSLFAKDGIMAGEGKVQIVQTKWFDIIFGEEAKESASVLYANADQIYEDLTEMYCWEEPPCRMPVVLTTQVEVFNAYFSTGNYSHIVLYVTNPIDDLANQPDSLLWTFRHELTHAYNYNMKNSVLKDITKVFGDAFTLQFLTVTPGVAEGGAVSSESFEGNGRLNDEFNKHIVKQAKIEGKFPKYSDVQGSRDLYPNGSFYQFNGAFHEYLQKKYGLETYAKFWYNCINNSITTSIAFNSAYGLKLREEWEKFEQQYKVPVISDDPLKSGSVTDLFNSSEKNYSLENSKGSVFTCLSQSEKGITYIDKRTSKVFFISKDELRKSEVKPKALFQYYFINSATQSLDGKFITVSYYDTKEDNYRYRFAIYNTETKKWYKPQYHGVKEGIIVKNGSDYFLAALKFKGEKSSVKITKLILDKKGNICGEENEINFDFTRTDIASSFIPVKEDTFAYILNESLEFSVELMNTKGEVVGEYKMPSSENLNHFIMHYLSVNNKNSDEIYFSWVSEGTMPRVGKINTLEGEFTLSQEDLSGGIYYPVKYDDDLLYVGTFYEFNKMFKKSSEFELNEKISVKNDDFSQEFESSNEISVENTLPSINIDSAIKPYNPFNYLKGTFVPLSEQVSKSYDSKHEGTYALPFGVTYITNNPWDSLTYMLSAGYGLETNSAAATFTVSGKTDTEIFTWNTSLFSEFDYKGWKAGEFKLSAGFNPMLTNILTLSINPSLLFHAGRSNASKDFLLTYVPIEKEENINLPLLLSKIGAYGNHDDLFYLYGNGSMIISLETLRRYYENRYSMKGFYAGFVPFYSISYDLTNSAIDYNYGDVTLFAEYYFPRILPFDCKYGKTYNLPLKLFVSAFSTSSISTQLIDIPASTARIASPNLAMAAAEVVLYGQEIQSSLRFLPFLYFHDIFVSAIGCVGFDYKSHRTDNFGFLYAPEFVSEIMDGKNKLMGVFAVKVCMGMNFLNFGALARSNNKNYISLVPTVTFKDFQSEPVFKMDWSLNIKF